MRTKFDHEYNLRDAVRPFQGAQDAPRGLEQPTGGREALRAVLSVYRAKEGHDK